MAKFGEIGEMAKFWRNGKILAKSIISSKKKEPALNKKLKLLIIIILI